MFWNWKHVFDAGAYSYYEHKKTGRRKAVRRIVGGYSPLDFAWLIEGEKNGVSV